MGAGAEGGAGCKASTCPGMAMTWCHCRYKALSTSKAAAMTRRRCHRDARHLICTWDPAFITTCHFEKSPPATGWLPIGPGGEEAPSYESHTSI
ncbi:hypothetical protein GCM10027276_07080 [Comamonas piscis]